MNLTGGSPRHLLSCDEPPEFATSSTFHPVSLLRIAIRLKQFRIQSVFGQFRNSRGYCNNLSETALKFVNLCSIFSSTWRIGLIPAVPGRGIRIAFPILPFTTTPRRGDPNMHRTKQPVLTALKAGAAAMALGLAAYTHAPAADETVKVGILHSLSGTMAISEVSLKDVVTMAVEEINAKGGVNGKKIETVVVDPASDWDLFAEKAKQLVNVDKVAVTFGCWTSVSRKSVLPVFEASDALLFYPVQYEGEECSKSVFYTGATPNQQLIPAAE